ncbi:MAG: hypothetical protein U9N07_09090 [Euryarchaeota archaeon]|nr:hypothetical protein [Euryarchaeota archaeon]
MLALTDIIRPSWITGVDVEKPIGELQPRSMNRPSSNPTFHTYPAVGEFSEVIYTYPSWYDTDARIRPRSGHANDML